MADAPQPISNQTTLHFDEGSALESFWACYEKKRNFSFEKKNFQAIFIGLIDQLASQSLQLSENENN